MVMNAPLPQSLPPLENGDRLTRAEFERRYAASPQIEKAELIEGVVYLASPNRFLHHAVPHSHLSGWLGTYATYTPGTLSGIEPTVRLDLENEFQPNIVLLLEEAVGGHTQVTEEGYLEGVPELVVEIAASSAAIDLGHKQRAYRRSGVREYIVWQSFEQQLAWFHLVDGDYQLLQPDDAGVIRSQQFPGLWLAVEALCCNQMAEVLKVLQAGIDSPEHAEFVAKLELQRSV